MINLYRRLRSFAPARAAFFALARSYERHWDALTLTDALSREAILTGSGVDQATFWRSGQDDAARYILPFVTRDMTVLDLGSGIGRVARFVATSCKEVLLVDVSSRMLRRARKHLQEYRNVRTIKTDGRSLSSIASETVDLAYSLLVFQHLEREDALSYFLELNRVLRPDAVLIFQVPNLAHGERASQYLRAVTTDIGSRAISRLRYYTEEEIRILLSISGFVVDELNRNGSFHVRARRIARRDPVV